ncbi:hypothetical protein [Caulobacter sp. AP07]|uniref:hypothetical protein n=1 Tax=Caulobacter sp. AP07 TaxID=1144304 RepID=UPI0002E8F39C|nr:hypothetical protein [Caulobacter sp. AP07]
MDEEHRRKRDELLGDVVGVGAEVGVEAGFSALAEFPPIAVACGVIAGVGLLGFLAWKGLARPTEKKNLG